MNRRKFVAFSVVAPLVFAWGGKDDNYSISGVSEKSQFNTNPVASGNPSFVSGQNRELTWSSAGTWMMDRSTFQFFGGEIHPARVPHQYWDHRIKMIKALGCNTISLYTMWNFHELPDGAFDFYSPDKDIGHFIDLCAANNMWVLLRSGPYVCAEWDFGGLPPRMLADPQFRDNSGNLQIRGNFPSYMAAVNKWNAALYSNVVKGRTLSAGGPIMLVALENEYTSWSADDPMYPRALAAQWSSLGYAEKFCVCDGWANGFKNNHIPLPAGTAYGLTADGGAVFNYAAATQNYGVASFGAECYPGWICNWGDSNQTIHVGDIANQISNLAKSYCSFVIYVGHGGTNFGFTAGGNGYASSSCQPVITSYDYGAPAAENGRPNANFFAIQAAYAANTPNHTPLAPLPPNIPNITDGEVSSIESSQFDFSDFLSAVSPAIQSFLPRTIEWIALTINSKPTSDGYYPTGVVVYETKLPVSGGSFTVAFSRPPDFAVALINGICVTSDALTTVESGEISPVTSFSISNAPPGATMQIVCMPFGRTNYGRAQMCADGRGLSGNVTLNGRPLTNWKMALCSLSTSQLAALAFGSTAPTGNRPFFAKATCTIKTPKDMYIDMSSWGTGYVFVNGHNLGRYWSSAGPQTRLYCPGVWLNNGGNTIVVFEFTLGRAAPIDFFGSSNLPYNVTSPVATVLVSGGVYTITNSLTGLLLGAYEGGTSAGPRLGITAATGGSEQQWIATSTGAGHWLITNAKSGLLMNVQGQDTANGTPLDLWSAGGRANQRFAMMPRSNGLSYAISSVQSARVVDVGNASTLPTSYGSTNVSAITLREDKRSASQSWIFTRIR